MIKQIPFGKIIFDENRSLDKRVNLDIILGMKRKARIFKGEGRRIRAAFPYNFLLKATIQAQTSRTDLKVWIDDNVVYTTKTGQKATLRL